MSVKTPKTSASQSDEQMIGAEANDLEPNNLPTSRIATAQLHLQSQINVLNYNLVGFLRTKKPRDADAGTRCRTEREEEIKDELENKLKKKKK